MLDPDVFEQSHLDLLAARSGEPIVTDQDEAEARYALASVWELVKDAGSPKWGLDTAPGVALQVLVEAAARLWMNLGGFTSERADAVTLARLEDFARGAELTSREVERLERAAGKDQFRGALRSAPVVNPLVPVARSAGRRDPNWVEPYAPWFAPNQVAWPYLPGDERANLAPARPRTREDGWW